MAGICPIVARGACWRNLERRAFTDRGKPNMVFGLALIHHLAIAASVPLAEVLDWFASFGSHAVLEFVEPHDPMADRLLRNKPAGMFGDYRIEVFERLLQDRFEVLASEQLPGRSRTLYSVTPRG